MIRLDDYRLIGYKNILEASLAFNDINVIIGPNNSGKSNFIQSISFVNYVLNSASTDDLLKFFSEGLSGTYFGEIIPVSEIWLKEANEFIISFHFRFSNSETNRVFNYQLDIEGLEEFGEVQYKIVKESLDAKEINKPGKPESIFKRSRNRVSFGAKLSKTSLFEEVPDFFSVIRILKLVFSNDLDGPYLDAINSLNMILKTPIFYFSNLELMKSDTVDRLNLHNGRVVSFELEEEIIKLKKTPNWNIFIEALNNILNIDRANIEEIAFGEDARGKGSKRRFLTFKHFGTSKYLRNFSDGTVLIIALITKILSNESDLIFIEEPENSTHPKALIDLFNFIKSFSENKQFIITTHSIPILNKTKPDNIIVSSVDENGKSTLYNVSTKKELRKRLNQGQINFSDELFFGNMEQEEFE